MRVLITGNGFLGKSLLSYLLKNTKDDIYTISRSASDYYQHISCDLLDVAVLNKTLDVIRPEVVYHTAGIALNKPDDDNPSFILRNNIEGTNNLLNGLKDCPRFVFASSVTVYGVFCCTYPPNWMSYTRPISLYATSKLACENLVRTYESQKRIDGTSIRIPALVGLNATHGLLKDIIAKVESDSPTLDLIGNEPGSVKPFQHVDEIAKIFYNVGSYKPGYEDIGLTCVVGNKDSITVKTVAELVMKQLGKNKEIKWSGSLWSGDNPEIYLNPCFCPPSSSTEAILKVLKEYKDNKQLLHTKHN